MPEFDLSTVIFALVALFVAWKLRSVLGMRQDSERPGGVLAPLRRVPGPAGPPLAQPDAPAPAPVPAPAADRWKGVAEPDPAVWSGLDAIAAADRGFTPQTFLSGARVAYDMVVHAFAAGDSATLRNLMAPGSLRQFRQRHSRPRGGGANDDDDGRVDRQRHDRRGSTRRPDRAAPRAVRRQARLRDPRRAGRRRRRVAQHSRRSHRLVDVRARYPLPRSQLAS